MAVRDHPRGPKLGDFGVAHGLLGYYHACVVVGFTPEGEPIVAEAKRGQVRRRTVEDAEEFAWSSFDLDDLARARVAMVASQPARNATKAGLVARAYRSINIQLGQGKPDHAVKPRDLAGWL